MPDLLLKNINKVYPNGFHAVHDFNLEIKEGEFIILVGPSGCGKSTTLRMIAGLEDITNGEFLIDEQLANQLTPKQRKIAMVFQSYALYPHLSVYDNLAFGLSLEGLDEEVIEEKVLQTAAILGLTDYLDRKPKALSGGQRQRVAVGRAIIRKVNIFLMDEPLSNLDAKQRVTMRSEISMLHKRVGATTIYVTHDQIEAMTMADRIVVMKDGFVQQIGTPKELYFDPANAFVAGFIGDPPMNFIDGMITNNTFVSEKAKVSFDLGKIIHKFNITENQKVQLAFRPESTVLGIEEGIIFRSKVELTELLGDNANVYCQVGDTNVILKTEPRDMPEYDSICEFSVPYENIYLFDAETGKKLTK